jgi:serine/threonine protein kinase
MAPEQTGRMNRSIDSGSDLYSLGVTFYQMLTGSLPFTASDPMEWVRILIEMVLSILSRDAEQRIAADATPSGNTVVVHVLDERVSSAVLPESVLHFVCFSAGSPWELRLGPVAPSAPRESCRTTTNIPSQPLCRGRASWDLLANVSERQAPSVFVADQRRNVSALLRE